MTLVEMHVKWSVTYVTENRPQLRVFHALLFASGALVLLRPTEF